MRVWGAHWAKLNDGIPQMLHILRASFTQQNKYRHPQAAPPQRREINKSYVHSGLPDRLSSTRPACSALGKAGLQPGSEYVKVVGWSITSTSLVPSFCQCSREPRSWPGPAQQPTTNRKRKIINDYNRQECDHKSCSAKNSTSCERQTARIPQPFQSNSNDNPHWSYR